MPTLVIAPVLPHRPARQAARVAPAPLIEPRVTRAAIGWRHEAPTMEPTA